MLRRIVEGDVFDVEVEVEGDVLVDLGKGIEVILIGYCTSTKRQVYHPQNFSASLNDM